MEEQEEAEIDLLAVGKALLKRWKGILLTSIITAVLALMGTVFFTSQMYDATVMLYVNVNGGLSLNGYSFNLSDLSASRSLVSTYSVIATREETLNTVLDAARVFDANGRMVSLEDKYLSQGKELEEVYEYEKFSKNIEVKAVNNTEIFYIKVSTTDPDDSIAIANAFLDVFPGEVSGIIKGTDAQPVHTATRVEKVSRGTVRNAAIGFIGGMVLACAAVFVVDVMINDTIDSADWLKDTFKESVPLLTIVPEESENSKYGYYRYYSNATETSGEVK